MAVSSPKAPDQNTRNKAQTEDQIRLHANLLDAVPAALIATDVAGQIIYWNRVAEELYGWSGSEVLDHSIMEVMVPPDNEEEAAEIMSLLRAGQSWTGEFKVKRRDGTCFTAMVTDSPVLDDGGMLIGIIGISHDLSARKRAEEAHRKAQDELETRRSETQVGVSPRRSRWRLAVGRVAAGWGFAECGSDSRIWAVV
jgi:PAS domain S-box-containing protein